MWDGTVQSRCRMTGFYVHVSQPLCMTCILRFNTTWLCMNTGRKSVRNSSEKHKWGQTYDCCRYCILIYRESIASSMPVNVQRTANQPWRKLKWMRLKLGCRSLKLKLDRIALNSTIIKQVLSFKQREIIRMIQQTELNGIEIALDGSISRYGEAFTY